MPRVFISVRIPVIFPASTGSVPFVIHDDNVGPYFCIPRHYLKQENFRAM